MIEKSTSFVQNLSYDNDNRYDFQTFERFTIKNLHPLHDSYLDILFPLATSLSCQGYH